ncbi:MAG: hypothetical protein DI585_07355 [Pseudomonas fluorescens]|nr:MAG: hypothetical protein DI585_07355 [Pseudomonas fluorescens]
MDIRVSAYRPNVTVSTVRNEGNPFATAYVQNANASGPVTATDPVQAARNAFDQLAANTSSDGYTDSVRGSIVNILA